MDADVNTNVDVDNAEFRGCSAKTLSVLLYRRANGHVLKEEKELVILMETELMDCLIYNDVATKFDAIRCYETFFLYKGLKFLAKWMRHSVCQ